MARRGPSPRRQSDAVTAREFARIAGQSYRALGAASGLSHTHVRRLLTGRRPVTEQAAAAIARALGVPLEVAFPLRPTLMAKPLAADDDDDDDGSVAA